MEGKQRKITIEVLESLFAVMDCVDGMLDCRVEEERAELKWHEDYQDKYRKYVEDNLERS